MEVGSPVGLPAQDRLVARRFWRSGKSSRASETLRGKLKRKLAGWGRAGWSVVQDSEVGGRAGVSRLEAALRRPPHCVARAHLARTSVSDPSPPRNHAPVSIHRSAHRLVKYRTHPSAPETVIQPDFPSITNKILSFVLRPTSTLQEKWTRKIWCESLGTVLCTAHSTHSRFSAVDFHIGSGRPLRLQL